MAESIFENADLKVAAGERAFTRLPVALLLLGAILTLPVHVIQGRQSGPVLGLMSDVHGAKYLPMRVLHAAVLRLDPADLRGS